MFFVLFYLFGLRLLGVRSGDSGDRDRSGVAPVREEDRGLVVVYAGHAFDAGPCALEVRHDIAVYPRRDHIAVHASDVAKQQNV